MKTQTFYLSRHFTLFIALMTISASTAFSQGNNWKITGNNNINEGTNFVGTTNAQDLNFGTNDTMRMTLGKNGGLNVTGQIVTDSMRVKGILTIGDSSIAHIPSFFFFPDRVQSSVGRFSILRGPNSFFPALNHANILVGIGALFPAFKLHINDNLGGGVPSVLGITNQATGIAVTDGFQVGIDVNGNAELNQTENLPMRFFTSNVERAEILAGGNVGIGNTAAFDAQSLLHLNRADNIAFSQYTNGSTGNTTAADGLRIGVAANGNAQIRQHEDRPIDIFTNDGALHTRKMRIFHDAVTNQPRVGIGLGATPLTHLHLGLDAFPNSGFRPWMNVGVLMYTSPTGFNPALGTDNMYVGMQRGENPDQADAIISWGNNPITTVGPDRLRFIFTAAPGNGQASLGPGLEIGRMIAFPNSRGNTGFGGDPNVPNFYSTGTPDPQNTVEINSPAVVIGPNNSGLRFSDLNSTAIPLPINPGPGVLAVDDNGDVIYVPDAPAVGIGDCTTPTTFAPGVNGAIDLTNNNNFHFLGNAFGAGVNNVMIGAVFPNCPIPSAKLHVEQASTDNSTTGILVNNTDAGHATDWCFSSIGIKSVVNTSFPINRRIAGWFEAKPENAADKSLAIFVPEGGGQVNIGFDCNFIGPTGLLLEVNSDILVNGIQIFSDQALKTNVTNISDGLDKINRLQGVYFEWDSIGFPEFNFDSGQQVGFIGQNVDTVIPEVVKDPGNGGFLTMDYAKMAPVIVEAIKELNAKIENLEDLIGECCEQEPVMVCHNGNTMTISQNALQAHLNHGDLLGPCPSFKTSGGNEGGGEINDPIYEKLASKGVILYDAVPNPFQGEVSIGFFIPERIINAEIVFHDNFGRTLKTVAINQRGEGIIIIDAGDLASGLYTYGIIADGQAIDTKKMVRSK